MAIDLKYLAIKIYSVRVNSMPEERTVSTFTWLTPALRSRMSVSTMTAMTQTRQYYKTEQKVSKKNWVFVLEILISYLSRTHSHGQILIRNLL
jgi:hypothetical protein